MGDINSKTGTTGNVAQTYDIGQAKIQKIGKNLDKWHTKIELKYQTLYTENKRITDGNRYHQIIRATL